MARLRTPLVVTTVAGVAVLSVLRVVLAPELWASSLAAFLFLPLAIVILVLRNRRAADPDRARRISGRLRASLVGGGVLLATALLLSITDTVGLTDERDDGGWRTILVLLPALIAVAGDLLGARLEREAQKEPD